MKKTARNFLALFTSIILFFTLAITPVLTINVHAAGEHNSNMAWEVLEIVNQERAANGLQPLTMDKGLMDAAQIRATEIVDLFSHTRPDGSSCFTVLPEAYKYGSYGENIAAGQNTASEVMEAWMNSPGHRANILNGNYNAIGIACFHLPEYDDYQYYWVQLFHSNVISPIDNGGVPTSPVTTEDGTIPMYRMYNPNSGEHFYTADYNEVVSLGQSGWKYEGVAWYAPTSGKEVYRMYNPNVGDHHYTLNPDEKDMLVALGWNYEGVCWYSNGSVPLYRAYNPNASTGSHHYTTAYGELANLVSLGWQDEGIAWYAER